MLTLPLAAVPVAVVPAVVAVGPVAKAPLLVEDAALCKPGATHVFGSMCSYYALCVQMSMQTLLWFDTRAATVSAHKRKFKCSLLDFFLPMSSLSTVSSVQRTPCIGCIGPLEQAEPASSVRTVRWLVKHESF